MSEYGGLTPREELELRRRREAEVERARNAEANAAIRAAYRKLKPPMSSTRLAAERRQAESREHIARARELEAQGLTRGQIASRMSQERGVKTDPRTVRRWLNSQET